MKVQKRNTRLSVAILVTASMALTSVAQVESFSQSITSPEVASDGRVTFRLLAPKAQAVRLATPDIPDLGQGVAMTPATNGTFTVLEAAMTRDTNGVWKVVMGPIVPGAYRYDFNVDGVQVIDPLNPATSESKLRTWSLVYTPGAKFMDTREVPHGAVAAVTYYSKSLQRFRRMCIYTPPGYENGKGRFPVLYLLHGLGDSDDSWPTVGRAGFILDNLIAAGKARPMIVVMPAGHTASSGLSPTTPIAIWLRDDDFVKEFEADIMPYVEHHYRVRADRQDRAIAGLSMGGRQALDIGIPHLDQFAYLGVFSSGSFRIVEQDSGRSAVYDPAFEEQNKAGLDNPKLKKGLKLVWFATGRDDFLLESSRATVEMLKQHNFKVVFNETAGAHSWINWRNYLNEFAPQLFQ
jgi:enterochelin esterase-like enzyme